MPRLCLWLDLRFSCTQIADPPNPAELLRMRRERPTRRSAEQPDELAPSHSTTSSARASSIGIEVECPGSLQVDDELELGELHDRQVTGLGALEDATAVVAGL